MAKGAGVRIGLVIAYIAGTLGLSGCEPQKPVDQNQPEQQQSSEKELSQDEIKNILHKNKEFIVKTFKAMQEKIDFFEREMSFLKSKVNSIGPKVREVVTNEVPAQNQGSGQQTEQPQAPVQNGGGHPRSGNYVENDVSIEKFF